jgi:hypothetical protein
MSRRVLRQILTAAFVAAIAPNASSIRAQEAERTADGTEEDADVRLLRAELLEYSTGDLAGALAIYTPLSGDAGVDALRRSEASLGIARVHQKRGELESARRVLEALGAEPGLEASIARKARVLLLEVSGRAAPPRQFDWVAELERNPDVQTRIFAAVMDCSDVTTAARAFHQLLGIGAVALPSLAQAFEASREPLHRRRLALVLVAFGRYEFLEAALAPNGNAEPLFAELARAVTALDAVEKDRFRGELRRIEEARVDPALRARFLILAGETEDLAKLLPLVEGDFRILEAVASHPEALAPLLERILDPESPRSYLAIADELFDRLEPAHIAAMVLKADERTDSSQRIRQELLDRLALIDGIDAALESPFGEKLTPFVHERVLNGAWRRLAENDDRAVSAWVRILHGPWETDLRTNRYERLLAWRPSPRLVSAMEEIIAADSTEVSLCIALEVLSLSSRRSDAVAARLRELAHEHASVHVRAFALYAVLQGLSSEPERGKARADVLVEFFERLRDVDASTLRREGVWSVWVPRPADSASPKMLKGIVSTGSPDSKREPRAIRLVRSRSPLESADTTDPEWISDPRNALLPEFTWYVDALGADESFEIHGELYSRATNDPGLALLFEWSHQNFVKYASAEHWDELARRTKEAGSLDAKRLFVASCSTPRRPGGTDGLDEYLAQLAVDSELDDATRLAAWTLISERVLAPGPDGRMLSFDWEKCSSLDSDVADRAFGALFAPWQQVGGGRGQRGRPSRSPRSAEPGTPPRIDPLFRDAESVRLLSVMSLAIESPRVQVRRIACDALVTLLEGSEACIDAVRPLLDDHDPEISHRVLDGLLSVPVRRSAVAIRSGYLEQVRPRLGNMGMTLSRWPTELHAELVEAAAVSVNAYWRAWSVGNEISSATSEIDRLERGLADPEAEVRDVALAKLLKTDNAAATRLLVAVVATEITKEQRLDVLARLAARPDPAAIGPIVRLLDDPSVDIRNAASSTLTAIRTELERRDEWRRLFPTAEKDAARREDPGSREEP